MMPEETSMENSGPEPRRPTPVYPPPERRRGSPGCMVVAVLAFLMLIVVAVMMILGSLMGGIDFETVTAGDAVAIVRVEGLLTDAERVVDELKSYSKNSSVKGMVIRIDSPGGFVVPAQEIYAALRRVRREKEIPIVASMGTVAASGGYYVALGADKIVANPGTATGSIGVILSYPTFGKLFDKIGVSMERLKSGEYKDIGDPSRALTEKEREVLRERLDDVYQQFVDVVAEARGMSQETVRALADGRVYTGRQAVELQLVDMEGDLHDAVTLAADQAGITGEPRVLMKKRRGVFGILEIVETTVEMLRVRASSPQCVPMFLMK